MSSLDTELAERLSKYTPEQRVPMEKCPMQRLIDKLDDETKEVVETTLFDPNFPYSRLHRELRRAGFKIKAESLSHHKKGTCVCRPGETT